MTNTNTNEENKMMKKTSQEIEIARNVANAISLMFTNREAALGELKKVDEAFRKVLDNKFANRAARIAAWKVSNKKN